MKEIPGLIYPDGQFKSANEIRRDMALRGELPQMTHQTEIRLPKDADEYLEQASSLAATQKELVPNSESFVEVTLPRTSIVSFWGDLHMFAQETNHERIRQELTLFRNTGDSYVVLGADLVDGIFWGGESGGEQIGSITHQQRTMQAVLETLKGRVIVGVSGEHDSKWAAKTGPDPYLEFGEKTNAPYVRGVGEILIHVGDVDYRMVVQHRARGFSMYNKNHPTYREARFDLQGADIYANFHTHRKQLSQETIRKFGDSTVVTHISSGAYKAGDSYGDRQGYPRMDSKEMFGMSIRLHADKKQVDVEYDILEAHRKWAKD